jgi:hypothetical protein
MVKAEPPPLHPPGPELARKNRRLIASRLGWPDGAVEACEAIDADNPRWHTSYRHADERRKQPAGFYALHGDSTAYEPVPYGATPDELRKAIADHRPARPWYW